MIDYPSRYRSALVSMVRALLEQAADEGLPGEHSFYLTFKTDVPDVGLSPTLRDVYPETMTIVLQHQFWNLLADEEGFSVTLRFGGRPESLFVPWHALTSFVDPAAEFGFELPVAEAISSEGAMAAETGATAAPEQNEPEAATATQNDDPESRAPEPGDTDAEESQADVVSFDRFRDARQPKTP